MGAGIEAKVPDVVSTGINSALAQVTSAAVSLDAKLSSGLDNLVEKMPALKEATPVFYDSTRDSVKSYATFAATYLASFTLAHVFLKATDLGLETTDGLLKWWANGDFAAMRNTSGSKESGLTALRKLKHLKKLLWLAPSLRSLDWLLFSARLGTLTKLLPARSTMMP